MNKNVITPLDLSARILELKSKVHQQETALRDQFSEAMQSISPGNLLKTGFKKLTDLPGLGPDLISSGLSIGANILSNKLLGTSDNTVKKLAVQALDFGLGTVLGKKADKVKVYTNVILNRIIHGNKRKQDLLM